MGKFKLAKEKLETFIFRIEVEFFCLSYEKSIETLSDDVKEAYEGQTQKTLFHDKINYDSYR